MDERTLEDCEELLTTSVASRGFSFPTLSIASEIKVKPEADDPSGDYASVDDKN